MMEPSIIENKGSEAVRKLRLLKLKNGQPFMINSKALESNHCYMEYPNGNIKIVTYRINSKDLQVVHELTHGEAELIRVQFKLYSE